MRCSRDRGVEFDKRVLERGRQTDARKTVEIRDIDLRNLNVAERVGLVNSVNSRFDNAVSGGDLLFKSGSETICSSLYGLVELTKKKDLK